MGIGLSPEQAYHVTPGRQVLVSFVFLFILAAAYFLIWLYSPYSHSVSAAAQKFPFVTLHFLHRDWELKDAIRAGLFFFSLAIAGLFPVLRFGLRLPKLGTFVLGCWLCSFLFTPAGTLSADATLRVGPYFAHDLFLAFAWTVLLVVYWAKSDRSVPRFILGTTILPLWMATHALMSYFFVFSLFF